MLRLAIIFNAVLLASGCVVYPTGETDGAIDDADTDGGNNTCARPCVQSKIDFDQDNQPAFELFYVCIDERIEQATELISNEVGQVQCKVSSPPDTCNLLVDDVCVGEIMRADPDTRRIDDEQWCGFCSLTALDIITRIKGGHYLP
jgi:hypothetical protein